MNFTVRTNGLTGNPMLIVTESGFNSMAIAGRWYSPPDGDGKNAETPQPNHLIQSDAKSGSAAREGPASTPDSEISALRRELQRAHVICAGYRAALYGIATCAASPPLEIERKAREAMRAADAIRAAAGPIPTIPTKPAVSATAPASEVWTLRRDRGRLRASCSIYRAALGDISASEIVPHQIARKALQDASALLNEPPHL